MISVAAFYKFVGVSDREALAESFRELTAAHNIFGTILVAHEGINGTVAGSKTAIEALHNFFINDERFFDLEYKESFADELPFYRMKVKIKNEIVTLGRPEANPTETVGVYVDPQQWHELLQDEETVVLDVRNDYEVAIGTFSNSINPKTESFREFPSFVEKNLNPAKHKKIAMSCTGGIRCEKASSLLKKMGFSDVYHLKGGVLRYLEVIKPEESMWQGECFVFDNRVAVKHGLELGTYDLCHGCRMPISEEDRSSELYEPGVSCPRCINNRSDNQRASAEARQKQIDLAKTRGQRHLGTRSYRTTGNTL